MNPEFSKLQQKEHQQDIHQAASQMKSGSDQERQFETVEELLRFDSEQNPVPGGVAEKLNESLAKEPPPPQSWWQKLFRSR